MSTGLILVDIQNDYFPGGRMELVGMDEAAQNAQKLLALFRKNKWPTLHIQHVAPSEKAPFFRPNTAGAEIHQSVVPEADDKVIQKHFPNSFRETLLAEALKNNDVEQVVICGAMSHMCIDATTRAAADLGFKCTLIHDACATRDLVFGDEKIAAAAVHGAFMAALGSAYAKVQNLDDYMTSIDSA